MRFSSSFLAALAYGASASTWAAGAATTLTVNDAGDAGRRRSTRHGPPQGGACDLGAIEADYVFVGEFD